VEEATERQTAKLSRILADLTARIEERLILCHSELAVNGMEQRGPLSPLIDAALMENGVGSGKWEVGSRK